MLLGGIHNGCGQHPMEKVDMEYVRFFVKDRANRGGDIFHFFATPSTYVYYKRQKCFFASIANLQFITVDAARKRRYNKRVPEGESK